STWNSFMNSGGDSLDLADMAVATPGRSGSGKRLTHLIPAGTVRGVSGSRGGSAMIARLTDQSRDTATLSYWVRFTGVEDWDLGGKLPGLAGVAPGVSESLPAGG